MNGLLTHFNSAVLSREQMKEVKGGVQGEPSCPDGGQANYCIVNFDSSTESDPYASTQSGGWVCGCGGSTSDAEQYTYGKLADQGVSSIVNYVSCY